MKFQSPPEEVQRALGFLSRLEVSEIDCGSIPASVDYGSIVALARQSGVQIGEIAVREAFQLMMRARCLAASGGSASA